MELSAEFAPLFKLPVEQRLQLAQELWDSIEDDAFNKPVPAWQLEELQRRLAEYRSGESETLSWDEVKRRLAQGE